MSDKPLSLYQLSLYVKEVVNNAFPLPIWVKAEISELHENRNGHCYLELIEKDAWSNKITAKFRAIIWDKTYRLLKPYFETTAQAELKSGINVLIFVKLEYNELYGISLQVMDIDPAFTIGNLEQSRALVIQQLISDGVFEMNKELEFPLVPQRIAIISSNTAAGYEDFCNQLLNNQYRFKFEVKLFKAYMQGDLAEQSIIKAMDKIPIEKFDVLIITRGGGSKSDLACFDGYDLANNVAQFPLPVIAAIGHERDTSVVDLVAHTRVKTPTAAAEFIIQKTSEYWGVILGEYDKLIYYAKYRFEKEYMTIERVTQNLLNVKNKLKLKELSFVHLSEKIQWKVQKQIKQHLIQIQLLNQQFQENINYVLGRKKLQLSQLIHQVAKYAKIRLKLSEQNLYYFEKNIDAYNPKHILAKGYSITLKDGKVLKSVDGLKNGAIIENILSNGKIKSKVI